MNELQIRLSADISALTSALNKAKATIKSFESETEKESEKGNVGFRRKIGLIEQLTNKAKALRVSLSQATNEQQIENYNRELENTGKELTRLNALGRSVTANLSGVGGGFGQIATKGANANGVTQEFNRIIQDAPFGLIGVGNNLQQLAGNFSQLSKTAGGTGKALAATFSSLISPVNLGLLAISALTAGFTAYQMGAFDFVTATDEAKTAQEEFNESLKDTEQTLKQGFFNELLKAQGLLKQENLGGRLIDVPAFQTADEVLQKLAGTIDGLNKNELEALESFLSQRLADAARASANATTELEKSLSGTDVIGYEKVLAKVNEQLKFYETDTKKSTKATKELKQEINSFSTDPLVDAYFEAIRVGAEFRKSIDEAAKGVVLEDPMVAVQNQIAQSLANMALPQKDTADIAEKLTQQKALVDELSGAYAGLGSLIGKAFKNPTFGSFLGQFIPFAAKLIATNFKVGTSAAIAKGAQDSIFGGPFTTGVFIAAAVGLVASAFASIGGGGRGSIPSASSGSGAPPQIYTNAQAATVPTPTNPTGPSGQIDFDKEQGRLEATVSGEDLVFIYERYKERERGGG